MCGIGGILAGDEGTVRQALPPLLAALEHRGPDDSGQELLPMGQRFLGLGHTRLAILDLSAAGHQPMVHPSSGDRLIYNGEIYNFAVLKAELERAGCRFVGHSDSEVLLHALVEWGPACLTRLQGMFAFAFHDVSAQTLLLARDAIGIKPLYTADLPEGGLVFASEVRAILATQLVSRRIDPRGVASLLAYGAVQRPSTIFRAIEDLPPGHFRIVTAGARSAGHRLERFWTPPPLRRDATIPGAVTSVRATVDAAIKDHLVSDVPLGIFLSSGLDSTIVAGVAARHVARLRSFTVGFAEDPDLSELAMAAETAALFGLDHTRIDVAASDAEAAMIAWLGSLDLPSVDGFNVFLISKFVRAAGIKVALSGQGGDELFGGYPTFADVPRLFRWFHVARHIPRPLRELLAGGATWRRSAAIRGKAVDIAGSDGSLLSLYLRRRRAMSSAQLRALGLAPEALGLTDDYMPPQAIPADLLDQSDPVSAVSRLETKFYLGNMLLRDGDVNGMSHALEIRVPLLDQRLLELALPLPGSVRLPQGGANKYLLRQAFPELLRPAILAQKKRGFVLPIDRWMRGPLRALCDAGLAGAKSVGLLDPRGVDGAWATFWRDTTGPAWSRAFTLVVLGLYLRDTKAVA
ncbi:MAG TPA: asparagine synthase (glutamine-hydrolyzing) [Polyangia bacterium]|jgi:asparagine synthase (glutamine-hydrolysing)